MKISLKNTPDQIELIRALAAKDGETARKAREAFAAFIGEVIQQAVDMQAMSKILYTDWPYNEDDHPTIPLDMFYNADIDTVQVWQQNAAGGMGSSLVTGLEELLISTYRLDVAVSLLEKNVRRGRLPYVSLALNRAAQETLRKQERNAWLPVLRALGEATTDGADHIITSTNQNILQIDDFNRLITLSKRMNLAWDSDSTPVSAFSAGATDAFLSPEMMQEIRGFVYQPMNTRGVPNSDESTAVPLPDSIRERIFNAGGVPELFNIAFHEMLEFGVNQRYNHLFSQFAPASVAHGSQNFDATDDEVILFVDVAKEVIKRPIAQNADNGSQLVMEVDDQFTKRSGKLGWFGALEEGRVVLDSRVLTAIIV